MWRDPVFAMSPTCYGHGAPVMTQHSINSCRGFTASSTDWRISICGASAADVVALVKVARSRVKERFGIVLETEVRLVGEFLADDVQELGGHERSAGDG